MSQPTGEFEIVANGVEIDLRPCYRVDRRVRTGDVLPGWRDPSTHHVVLVAGYADPPCAEGVARERVLLRVPETAVRENGGLFT